MLTRRRRAFEVHIVMDNYATHKTPKIKAWLARRPRYHVHYRADFGIMDQSGRALVRRGNSLENDAPARRSYLSRAAFEADIRTFIDRHNDRPKPFKWVKSADQILASVKRFCHKTQQTLCREL